MRNEMQCPPLEMWAGIECTVNRVGDEYGDQMRRNGHEQRIEDIERFAALGIKALRYPVLWEKTAPSSLDNIDWNWAETRLNRLRDCGIRPIVGLTHHGSGPRHTSLIDASFADGLAAYAGKVAEKFPWVSDWTPVNEPLTTARFSGLYGHWYPHGRDEATFARALVNECRGVALAMAAIRRVNPAARLVQTDDLGHVYSSPRMTYQADFENERRWLGWDLLCGRVDTNHRMWGHLIGVGIGASELDWFLANPCKPDILGVNHYLTSDRYLDENTSAYPPATIGDNGRERYADVEAVRVLPEGVAGIGGVLREAWERYGIPLAVTEAHLGCTREEQLRWLRDVWAIAQAVRNEGVDVRAVTAWALLGSYDWNSLLTRFEGHYESGVFDVRSEPPRPTALAGLIRELANGQTLTHPALDSPGWWHRPKRTIYVTELVAQSVPSLIENERDLRESARPLLLVGSDSVVGSAFARLCDHRGLACRELPLHHAALSHLTVLEAALEHEKPWAVLYAADCENPADASPALFRERNVLVPAWLAEQCALRNVPFVFLSSDAVFSGGNTTTYCESSRPNPRTAFGRSKAKAESAVLAAHSGALVVRSGPLFGPWDAQNFLTATLSASAAGQRVRADHARIVSPTYLPDFVHACLDLLIDGESGVWHLANPGRLTPFDFAALTANRAGLNTAKIVPHAETSLRGSASASSTVLVSERAALLQPLENAVTCYLHDCGIDWNRLRTRPVSRRKVSAPRLVRH